MSCSAFDNSSRLLTVANGAVSIFIFLRNKHENYFLTQKVIEIVNNSYTPSNILQSSNNPNIYERLHKSSKLLFNSYRERIKTKIKDIKIGFGPETLIIFHIIK